MDQKRPKKKNDYELYDLLLKKIWSNEYIFKTHAKIRQKDRGISDLDILSILEGKLNRGRCRNKGKDKFENCHQDWNYCIEGLNLEKRKIRIIISFNENLLLIITAMWIEL